MPSNQEPGKECWMGIIWSTKELRERASRLIVATRHNPALGIMPKIMQTWAFPLASMRDSGDRQGFSK